MSNHQHAPRIAPRRWLGAALLAALVLLAAAAAQGAEPAKTEAKNSCVDCHSDSRFLVQNKKLYDYFQGWKLSVHAANDVTCSDCHGGDPKAADKKSAHSGAAMGSAARSSAINYQNIPATCARCHKEVYKRFKLSAHYEHLKDTGDGEQGPNCVTCHGSVNTTVLNVTTVRQTCAQCHNDKTGNSPEIPAKAEEVLNNFLSINRYYRFIALRSTPEEGKAFFQFVDPVIKQLNADWHTFDIDAIDQKTHDLVQFMKVRRNDLLQSAKSKRK